MSQIPHTRIPLRYTALLLVLCALSLFLFLDAALFNTRGEPREAVVAMSMLQDGNWILPVNNGDEIAFKPPMLHWFIAAFSWIGGQVTEFTSRLPSALAGTVMVLATFGFFARRRGEGIALIAAMITLTNFEVHRSAMACRVDMLLAAFMVLAFFALYRWGERNLRGVPWLAIGCLAGAALTKGPVGIVVPCGAAALFFLMRGRGFWELVWKFLLIALAALIPLVLWYYAAWQQPHGGERFLHLIYEENWLRFTGQMTYASHVNPWPYNVQMLLAGFMPYTLILVLAIPMGIVSLRGMRRSDMRFSLRGLPVRLREADPVRLFTLTALLFTFVFYCIPASKRSVYLLPCYPFAAYFLAELFLWLRSRHPMAVRALGILLTTAVFLLTLTFVAVKCGLVPDTIFSGRHATQNILYLHALRDTPIGLWAVILTLIPLGFAAMYLHHRSRPLLHTLLSIVFCLQLALDGLYIPAIMSVKSDRDVAQQIKKLAPTGQLYSYRFNVVEGNRMHPFTINFYLGDRIIPLDKAPSLPAEGLVVLPAKDIDSLRRDYPALDVSLALDPKHRSCDDHADVQVFRFRQAAR